MAKKADPIDAIERARTAMELFDVALNILSRIRPLSRAQERSVHAIQKRLAFERNACLGPLDLHRRNAQVRVEEPKA